MVEVKNIMKSETKREDGVSRVVWVDVARSFAIICVIVCHSVEGVYPLDLQSVLELSSQARIFVFAMMTIGRLGVPIFLILTGYLLLGRNYNVEESIKFWKTKCIPLLITTEIWRLIYWFFVGNQVGTLDFENLVRQLLFLKSTEINHLWYLPMILGIYLFIPFISNAIHRFPSKILWVLLGIVVVYLFLVPFINMLLILNGEEGVSNQFDLSYSGGIYGVYLILGYLISKKKYSWKFGWCVGLGTTILAVAVGTQEFFYISGIEYRYWYDSIFIFGLTICAAFATSQIKKIPGKILFYHVAKCSFGIYLVHNIILTKILQLMPMTMDRVLKVVLVTVLSFVISLGVVMAIAQVPKIRKVLFFMK